MSLKNVMHNSRKMLIFSVMGKLQSSFESASHRNDVIADHAVELYKKGFTQYVVRFNDLVSVEGHGIKAQAYVPLFLEDQCKALLGQDVICLVNSQVIDDRDLNVVTVFNPV